MGNVRRGICGAREVQRLFQVIYMVFVYLDPFVSLELVWNLSDHAMPAWRFQTLVSVEIERVDCGKDPELIRGSGSFYGFWCW